MLLTLGWLLNVLWTFQMTATLKRQTVGLPFALTLSTTFLYIGFIAFLNPEYNHLRPGGSLYLASYRFTRETVEIGVLISLLALTFFNIGVFASRFILKRPRRLLEPGQLIIETSFRKRLITGLATFGVSGFALSQFDFSLPLIDAMTQVARNAAITVLCLGPALTLLCEAKTSYGRWAVAGLILPLAYILLFGFVSYGFIAFCCLLGFYVAFLRKARLKLWQFLTTGLGGTYLLLSAFIAWMNFRDTLRDIIASGAPIERRVDVLVQAALSARPLNWSDFQSLDFLTIRLNQYIFVGKAVELHTANPTLRLWGETIWVSMLAWIPRFIWPGKPEMNTTQFMRDHTGIPFTNLAAFGNGPVMEFYVNFSWPGVIFGFLILGFLLAKIDSNASNSLRSGDVLKFCKWFTVGLAFVAPLTSLFFMVNTAIATYAIFSLVQYVVGRPPISVRSAVAFNRGVSTPQQLKASRSSG